MRALAALTVLTGILLAATPAMTEDKALAAPTQLNPHVVVSEHVVRLGDLFTNAGKNSETPVAYAPEPGKTAVLDARWLYRVAAAYKVNWRPLDARAQTIVERASVEVPIEDVKARILDALADRGLDRDSDIEFSTRLVQIFLPADSMPTIEVDAIEYFERTGRFTALISAPGMADASRMRLSGRVFRTIDVPVLSDRVLRGDVIREADIRYVRLNADRVQTDTIVDASELIGMTPRRGIRAGSPIRPNDVRRPLLVNKNSLVIIVHKMPNMLLTAQGKALENGADGDVIQIRNAQSDQVIEAEVIGPGKVAVHSLAQQISMSLN